MTPRHRLARRLLGLGAVLCLIAALASGAMALWLAGSTSRSESAREVATAICALGMALYAYGRWRRLR